MSRRDHKFHKSIVDFHRERYSHEFVNLFYERIHDDIEYMNMDVLCGVLVSRGRWFLVYTDFCDYIHCTWISRYRLWSRSLRIILHLRQLWVWHRRNPDPHFWFLLRYLRCLNRILEWNRRFWCLRIVQWLVCPVNIVGRIYRMRGFVTKTQLLRSFIVPSRNRHFRTSLY